MRKLKFTLLLFTGFLYMNANAQNPVRETIDKAAKDPKREENAAKADVRLHKPTIGADTAQVQKTTRAVAPKKKKKMHRKKGTP